jgi:PST family polysaccharide transporter
MINISEDKKRLLSNFFSLSALQGVNMILPLITLPYLVRVLGVENFGLLSFSLSIIMYFNILVSFGFELSATREISLNRDDKQRVSEIFSSVMFIKLLLSGLSLIILFILGSLVGFIQEHLILYVVTFGVVIGNFIFPSWLFQGMEKMKYITYINVVTKVICTILIFILVENKNDYIYVPALNSLAAIFSGLYSLILVYRLFGVKFQLPSTKAVNLLFKESYHFFLSRVANNGSRYYATTVIGLYFGNTLVGYYSMVEKLFYAFMSVGGIISQTIFPFMSRTKNIVFFKRMIITITIVSIVLVIPIMYFNEFILYFVFGIRNDVLSTIFILVFSGSVFGIVSSLIGYPLLAAFGYVKYANNSFIISSFAFIVYITITSLFYPNIFVVVFSLPLYMIVGFIVRVYYVKKTRVHKSIKVRY